MTIKSLYLSLMAPLQNTSNHILDLADRCVKCGLCLPQCPTYELAANENESPRGRVALIQGWLTGQLTPSKTLTQHIDQCLLCRRCERVCPSQVAYGEIIDEAKALLNEEKANNFSLSSFIANNSLKILLNKKTNATLIFSLRLLQKTGLLFLSNKSGLLKILGLSRLASYLPILTAPIKTKSFYPANDSGSNKGNVSLFTGCLSKQIDPATVNASIKLLNHLGYGVYVPEQQVCCGALHLHEGNKQQAIELSKTNIHTFNQQENITAIVSIVNGCTSQLREYPQMGLTEKFTHKVKDIIEFLAEIEWPENIKLQPLDKVVAVQIPCSLQNSLRAEDKLISLIKRIPQLNLDTIYNKCCGAAGSYFLRQAKLSDQLKEQAITKIKKHSPEIIISSNLGCALQLKSGLSQSDNPPQVIHPVVLLEQQLLYK